MRPEPPRDLVAAGPATFGRDVIRREPALLHPRLTVVPVGDGSRPEVLDAPGRTVVGRAELRAATEVATERRRAALQERIAALRADLVAAEERLADADEAVERRRADRDSFRDAAAWTEALPEVVRAQQVVIDDAEADLVEQLRESREASRALDRVLEQRASADAAIAEARRQLRALAAEGSAPEAERQRAAAALAAQAESVEARLAEAEASARARSEQSKRAVTEGERAIEQLTREQRDRHKRLRELVECLPGDARPPHDEDPLDHTAGIAAGLRLLADTVDRDVPGLVAVADRHRADCDHRRAEVEGLEASVGRVEPEDAAEALAELVGRVAEGVVVLDDVVAGEHGADTGLLRALEAAEPAAPLVLLTADPGVLGWAIDLPADAGALAGPRTIDLLTVPSTELVSSQPTALPSRGDNP